MRRTATALAVAASFILIWGCGSDNASQEELAQAHAEGAKEAREEARIRDLQREVKKLKQQNWSGGQERRGDVIPHESGPAGPVRNCTDGIRANASTTCDFAMNVAGEYGSNPGASTISAYSPMTGKHYTMRCGPSSGGGILCTGGNNAAVYIP